MKKKLNLVKITCVFALFFNFLLPISGIKTLNKIGNVQASTLLTHNDVKKFEGLLTTNSNSTSYIKPDGTVFSTGSNNDSHILYDEGLVSISSTNSYTAGVKSDGTVVVTGKSRPSSIKTATWEDIVSVAAAQDHLVGLQRNGRVVATGTSLYGNLNVNNWTNIVQVAAGGTFTVGLREDGTIAFTGLLLDGLEDLENWTDIVSIAASNHHVLGLKSDGTVLSAGFNQYGETNVSDWHDIIGISASDFHSVGVKNDGTVVVSGQDNEGETNVSDWKNIVAISTEDYHIIGLKSDGSLIGTGRNYSGETSVDNWDNIQKLSSSGFLVALKNDGTVTTKGIATWFGNANVLSWKNITSVAVGNYHTVGLKEDGTVIATGNNTQHQIDVGDWHDIVAIDAGGDLTLGLKSDGTVLATGANYYGEANVNDWHDIVAISTNGMTTIGLKNDGTVVATGDNQFHQTDVSNWKDIVAISNGWQTVGLKKDGTVVSTNFGNDGQSQMDDWKDIKQVSASLYHVVGLKNDGTVVSTGDGGYYGLDEVKKWKDIVQVDAGYNSTIGLKSDGTVVFVGDNSYYQPSTLNPTNSFLTIDKDNVQPNDSVTIKYKPNPFYTIDSNKFTVSGGASEEGQMTTNDANEKLITYQAKESDAGKVHLTVDGVRDVFGHPLTKKNLFEVNPFKNLTASKNKVATGETVTLKASFYQSVKPNILISLSDGVTLESQQMNEVEGSNGKEFTFDYIATGAKEGNVNAKLTNIVTTNNVSIHNVSVENVFTKQNQTSPVQYIKPSVQNAKDGDPVSLIVKFTKPIKNNFNALLNIGGQESYYTFNEVSGSNGTAYSTSFIVRENMSGPLSVSIKNIYDQNDELYQDYLAENVMTVDGSHPRLLRIGTENYQYKVSGQVRIIAEFNEPVKPGFKVRLTGTTDKVMTPIEGSNGTKYETTYTVKEGENSSIWAEIQNATDLVGNKIYSNYNHLFLTDGIKPTVSSVVSDKPVYEKGDFAHFVVTYSEPISNGSYGILKIGDRNEPIQLNEVSGSNRSKYEFYYEVQNQESANVDIELGAFIDDAGNQNTVKKSNIFSMSDPTNANLTTLQISSGTTKYALSPTFSPSVHSYTTTVPISMKTINLAATSQDVSATVLGAGSKTLKYGINPFNLTVTSKNGTKSTYTVNVKVTDNIKPIISGVTDKKIQFNTSFKALTGVSATDNVDGNLTSKITVTGSVNVKKKGTYTLTYRVKDKSGNEGVVTRKITVYDSVKPVLSGVGTTTVKYKGTFDTRKGVRATDNADGDLTKLIKITGTVNTKKKGNYYLTYSVADKSGNRTTVKRKVVVK
ncbi:immunoglobulin-like domain-containing protein [Gottfriedia acidiceleris]|uniref:immunoglobulin-like domain-containing protein n=1 Tax=Gottfriedia acidiceleris TaxID=371036 RepID=UPI0030009A5C